MQSKRARRAATAGLLLCMLAACASPRPPPDPPLPAQQVPPADEPMPPLEGTELPSGFRLVDRRGLVADVRGVVPQGGSSPRVEPIDGGLTYLLSWVGGSCDVETVLTVTRSGASIELILDVSTAALGPDQVCAGVGIFRTLQLTFRAPIAPDRITLRAPDPRLQPDVGFATQVIDGAPVAF